MSVIAIASCCVFFICSGCCFLTATLFQPRVTETAESAIDAAATITNWTVPDEFSGKSRASVDNSIFRFDVARFEQNQGRGLMILGQFFFKWPTKPYGDLQLQELMEQSTSKLKKINLESRETRRKTIRSVPAEFEIGRGEDRATTTRYRQVIGRFKGKTDRAVIILQCEEEFITDEQIDRFIESIE